jgi:hypothetical protein
LNDDLRKATVAAWTNTSDMPVRRDSAFAVVSYKGFDWINCCVSTLDLPIFAPQLKPFGDFEAGPDCNAGIIAVLDQLLVPFMTLCRT